ncbi:hypothetical protein MBLNU459_g5446t1 [Dothideomycetes sp. NU459]
MPPSTPQAKTSKRKRVSINDELQACDALRTKSWSKKLVDEDTVMDRDSESDSDVFTGSSSLGASRAKHDITGLRKSDYTTPPRFGADTTTQNRVYGMGNSILSDAARVYQPDKSERRQQYSEYSALIPGAKRNRLLAQSPTRPVISRREVERKPEPRSDANSTDLESECIGDQQAFKSLNDFTAALSSISDLRSTIVDTMQLYGDKIAKLEQMNRVHIQRIEGLQAANEAQGRVVLELKTELGRQTRNTAGGLSKTSRFYEDNSDDEYWRSE